MSQVAKGVGGRGTKTTVSGQQSPNMKDFDMTNVRIERAQNGVVVECNHKMKPEAQAKMGKGNGDYVDYDSRNPTEKHVFNDMESASKFIKSRLAGEDYDAPQSEPAEKTKVRVI